MYTDVPKELERIHTLIFELFHNRIFQKNGFAVTGVLFLKFKGLNIRKCNMNSLKCKDLGKECYYVSIGDLAAVRCIKCGKVLHQQELCKTEGCRRKAESGKYCKHCTDHRERFKIKQGRDILLFRVGEIVTFFKTDNRIKNVPKKFFRNPAEIIAGPIYNGTYLCQFKGDEEKFRIHGSRLKRARGREVAQTIMDGTENV